MTLGKWPLEEIRGAKSNGKKGEEHFVVNQLRRRRRLGTPGLGRKRRGVGTAPGFGAIKYKQNGLSATRGGAKVSDPLAS